MNSNLNLSASNIKSSISHFFNRFHFIIFFVFSVGGLAVAVFMLYGVIQGSDNTTGYTSTVNNTSFDTATIDKLRALKQPGQETDKLDLSGRINPFSE